MNSLLKFSSVNVTHLARCFARLQLLSLLLLGLNGCVSAPPQNLSAVLPEGIYKFDCPIVYQNGFAELSHRSGLVHVQLLEDFTGSFSLKVSRDGRLEITEDQMDYPGLKRSFKGEGKLLRPGSAEGTAVVWLKSIGPVSRNHREGPWVLFQAPPDAAAAFKRKQQNLQERKARAENTSPHNNTQP